MTRFLGARVGAWLRAWLCVVAVCGLFASGDATAQPGCVNTLIASANDDGIGGTGVFGTVTGLGSLCVNGLHITYTKDVSVMIFGEPARASRLGVGHVVWVVAHRLVAAEGVWVARSITAFSERVGRVESIGSGSFSIDAEAIVMLDDAWRFAEPGEPGFEMGDWIAVSGLRRADGVLVASRIDRAQRHALATPFDLAWLLQDSTLARFSIEGYLGTSALSGLEIESPIDAGARVWIESVVEDGHIRPTGIIERVYPGDVIFPPGVAPDWVTDPTPRGESSSHAAKTDSKPDQPRFRPSLRNIWSRGANAAAMPDARPAVLPSVPPAIDIPIDPVRPPRIDSVIDIRDIPIGPGDLGTFDSPDRR